MSDFNQPTRRQDKQVPSVVPQSGEQTRQTQHGSIERNPDAPTAEQPDGEPFDTDDSLDVVIGDEPAAAEGREKLGDRGDR
jgi:hypothetical protein